jgi:putative oxygen-independent coproporphyrinogen III oxidase
MPSALPDGEPAPDDGRLPPSAVDGVEARAFGVYLHVPFCAVRCGYCDFNTYTTAELGPGAVPGSYPGTVIRELDLAADVLRRAGAAGRPASTVFFGGGTPTLLPVDGLARMLDAVAERFGLADGAEVTVEANPESVTAASLAELARRGVTRMSFGMQSAVPHVLAALDRVHRPERVPEVVGWSRDAGLAVSLDLIYGTPGESAADWRASVEAALNCRPDHVSAYALVVEEGTWLAGRVRRGEIVAPDDDDLAEKYELADELLGEAGFAWYEVSNWARSSELACRHNLGYWRGDDWWGAGPGAHSHVGSVRWWNVRHPRAYAQRLATGLSPAAGRELLDTEQLRAEQVLLGVRLASGMPVALLEPAARTGVAALVADGLVDGRRAVTGEVVLTRRGRLLADTVVRALLV